MNLQEFETFCSALAELNKLKEQLRPKPWTNCPACSIPYDHEHCFCDPPAEGVYYCNETGQFYCA